MKLSRILLIAVPVAVAVVFFAGILPRIRAAAELQSRASAASRPVVNVVLAAKSSSPAQAIFPAAIQALQDTPIYARTTGYIAKWTADIGDRVKAGEVMAVIDGPDLDQELNQARAALEQSKANNELARISADRWKELGAQNAVAQQDVDQKTADFAAGKAAVVAAQANVDRLAQLKDFQQVTAPYDGVVTARNAQVGALISAGSGTEIFHIAQTDTLRVFVSVPQSYVRSVRLGLPADVLVPEFPGRVFRGSVARFAGALDSASRTLLTEVRLPNTDGVLFPGMFGQVRFTFQAAQPAILLPSNAAIITAAGTLVATVDPSDRIRLVHVTLGRDFGNQVEIEGGLDVGARVVSNPSDSLTEGLEVSPVAPEAPAGKVSGRTRICRWVSGCALLLGAGCAVGPDYRKPEVAVPPAYSEKGPWRVAQPKDSVPKAGWWRMFGDPELDSLEEKAAVASPTLRAALARFDEALAAARLSRAALYPTLAVNSDSYRERFSAHRQSEYPGTTFAYTTSSFDLPLNLSYEVDLFGQVRRSIESATAAAQAQGAAYQNVLLTLQAGVAQNYFALRSLATQRDLLQRNVNLLAGALDLVRKLRKGGANSDLDVFQAEAELATVEDAAAAADQSIAEQQHALAVLVGENPESFRIEARPLDPALFPVPVGLPSELLERRPDVASAERTMAATNARIGVAKAAFFPSIGLTAFAGANSGDLTNLLTWGSREWAAGPFVSVPIFNGGANSANYRQAQAAYDEAVANYRRAGPGRLPGGGGRRTLRPSRILARQVDILGRAVTASTGASNLSVIRYKAGLVSYIEVIDSQRTQLQSELSLADARAARLTATVLLIRALGGGW